MKKSTKCLFALLLMLGAMLEMKAADVYLLTAEKINGVVGKYEVPSNHQLAPNTSYGSNVYSLKITSMPRNGILVPYRSVRWGGVIRCSLKSMVIRLR